MGNNQNGHTEGCLPALCGLIVGMSLARLCVCVVISGGRCLYASVVVFHKAKMLSIRISLAYRKIPACIVYIYIYFQSIFQTQGHSLVTIFTL